MTNRTKAKLIKWAYILGNLLIAVIFMLIVAVAKQTSTIIVAGILFLLFLGASVLIPLDFDLEDIILRRLLHNENLHKKTTEQMSDSERIQELEKKRWKSSKEAHLGKNTSVFRDSFQPCNMRVFTLFSQLV